MPFLCFTLAVGHLSVSCKVIRFRTRTHRLQGQKGPVRSSSLTSCKMQASRPHPPTPAIGHGPMTELFTSLNHDLRTLRYREFTSEKTPEPRPISPGGKFLPDPKYGSQLNPEHVGKSQQPVTQETLIESRRVKVFTICFMLAAPFFGYLGDRYNRKIILSAGIFLWSGVTLGSSFIPESYSWIFFLSRGFVGVGTASYSTIAPTILADLFEKDQRTLVLSVFYIFIPVGSGLGYVLASGVTQALGHWHWAFRVSLLLTATGHTGQSINSTTQGADEMHASCRSYMWSSLGVTAMTFVLGALGFWTPLFLSRAEVVHDHVPPCLQEPCNSSTSLIFGGITIVMGIAGVLTGAQVARRCKKINIKADPLICAVGILSSAPCFYLAIILAAQSIIATYIFIALGEFLLSLNWAIVADILLYVVIPKRQSTAVALQILVSHLLGDSGSPYLIGIISNAIQTRHNDSHLGSFRSLQYSFIICAFIGVLGGGFFLLTALYVEEDRKDAQQLLAYGKPPPPSVKLA
uniref:Sphingolipid transporter 3 (putative) n=1 Tax=Pelusios castaneus TaxID=367368 RepID=A0A8C8RIV7_9SAUR